MTAYPGQRDLDSRLEHVVRRANEQLRRTPQIQGMGVECDCRDGAIRLRGRLPSYYKKQVAQEAVMRVDDLARLIHDGMTELVNEIEVRG
jgi:hypothetical protein